MARMTTRSAPRRRPGPPRRPAAAGRRRSRPRTAVRIAILGGIAMALLGHPAGAALVPAGDQRRAVRRAGRGQPPAHRRHRGRRAATSSTRDGTAAGAEHASARTWSRSPRELTGDAPRGGAHPPVASSVGVPVTPSSRQGREGRRQPAPRVGDPGPERRPRLYRYLAERRRDFPGIQPPADLPALATPRADLAAHVLGHRAASARPRSPRTAASGYAGDETVGVDGIEQQYEEFLAGTPGRSVVEVDAAGEPQGREYVSSRAPGARAATSSCRSTSRPRRRSRAASPTPPRVTGRPGRGGRGHGPAHRRGAGAGVVPDLLPGGLRHSAGRRRSSAINKDPDVPLLDRAIAGLYPAGSTFKPITAAAAPRGRRARRRRAARVAVGHHALQADVPQLRGHSHGIVTLPTALEVSSDTYFYQVADRLWPRRTRRSACIPLQEEARAFGLGRDDRHRPARREPRGRARPAVEAEDLRGLAVHRLPAQLAGRRHDPARRRARGSCR